MLFLLTGSAASGKSAVLNELARRSAGSTTLDLDDARPRADAGAAWWRPLLADHIARALADDLAGRDTILAGWTSLAELRAIPAAPWLEVSACLLDCEDHVRLARIERRAASGTWRTHTPEELEKYVSAAGAMRKAAAVEPIFCLDSTRLSVYDVADRVERWMATQRTRRVAS